jgi:hypothetical protein
MPPNDYAEALNFVVRMKLEPVWDGGPKFKKIPGKSGYRVTQQRNEKPWPLLIKLLELNTKADTDRFRKEVMKRLGIESQE